MKYDHHNCTECGVEYHEDHEWHRNSSDMLVCDNCADNLPEYYVEESPYFGGFYGVAERRDINGRTEVTAGDFKTRVKATSEILKLVSKIWGDTVNPIEKGAN